MTNRVRKHPGIVEIARDSDEFVDLVRLGLARFYPSFVLQNSGNRGVTLAPVNYSGDMLALSVTIREGDHVVFAKLNVINEGPLKTDTVSIICELIVGTQVDKYEMLDIQGLSMRAASLIVGANLTAPTEAQIVVKRSPPNAPIKFTNLVIASIQVGDLTVLRTGHI